MQSYSGNFVHGRAVAVAGRGSGGTEVLLVRAAGSPGAAGAQRAVALGAPVVHRLHQDAVDLFTELHHIGCGDPVLVALGHREHVFIQRAPDDRRNNRDKQQVRNSFLAFFQLHSLCGCQLLHESQLKHRNERLLRLLRSDFVASHDEGHLAAPGVDEGGPAGVDGHIFATAGAHPQRRILKRLPSKLEN